METIKYLKENFLLNTSTLSILYYLEGNNKWLIKIKNIFRCAHIIIPLIKV